jgi:hypothetical protein
MEDWALISPVHPFLVQQREHIGAVESVSQPIWRSNAGDLAQSGYDHLAFKVRSML